MHGFRGWWICGILLLALVVPVVAAETADDLPSVEKTLAGREYSGAGLYIEQPLLSDLDHKLSEQLASLDPPRAIAQLAKQYQLPVPVMRDLVRIWVFANTRPASGGLRLRLTPALKMRLISLVRESGYAPLPLAASYYLLWHDGCGDQDFSALLKDAPDPAAVAWQGIVQTECPNWRLLAVQKMPELGLPSLYWVLFREQTEYTENLVLSRLLLRPEMMRAVADGDRARARIALSATELTTLLDLGLSREAVAFYDGLPGAVQAVLLTDQPEVTLHVAGRAIPMRERRARTLPLAEALYLSGDRARAEKLFARLPDIAAMRRYRACHWTPGRKCKADGQSSEYFPQMAVLDALLHGAGKDPYPVAEAFFSDNQAFMRGVDVDLACALFSEENVRPLCAGNRRDFARELSRDAPQVQSYAETLKTTDPTSVVEVESAIRRYSDFPVIPEAVPTPVFPALPLPAAFAGHVPPPLPYDFSFSSEEKTEARPPELRTLPRSFLPLRWQQLGKRITVVSASDAYEDGFSIIRGGYWVNISTDGGRSWRRPLYTGLQDRLPYQIVTDSKMPLVAGDSLNLEVDKVSLAGELSFPVWNVAIVHDVTGFYLHIPLKNLRRDSDGDGITDLAEKRLLLDPHNPDSDGDGIADGVDAMPNVKAGAGTAVAQRLTGQILRKWFRCKMHGTGRVPPSAVSNPVMVFGNPADFVGLRPGEMLLVYPESDEWKLNPSGRFLIPHFGPVIRNRAGTRGFLVFNSSVSGFTLRARRVHGKWLFDRYNNWIS